MFEYLFIKLLLIYSNGQMSDIQAYLPGTGSTVIKKAVSPGRGLSIALRLGWSLRLPQMWATRVRNFLVWGTAFALSPVIKSNVKKSSQYIQNLILLLNFIFSTLRLFRICVNCNRQPVFHPFVSFHCFSSIWVDDKKKQINISVRQLGFCTPKK